MDIIERNLTIEKVEKINYPIDSNYSESVCVVNNKLYIPINDAILLKSKNSKNGLYVLDLVNIISTPDKGTLVPLKPPSHSDKGTNVMQSALPPSHSSDKPKNELKEMHTRFSSPRIAVGSVSPKFAFINRLFNYRSEKINQYFLRFVFAFPNKSDVILGGKVNEKEDLFVGCNTYDNTILVYYLKQKLYKYIKLTGCPNDLCFSKDEKSVFVVMNIENSTYCGLLIKLNIETEEVEYILGNTENCIKQFNLYSVSGIGITNDILYIATLPELYSINTNDYTDFNTLIDINNKNSPLYDNITFYHDSQNKTLMNVAVFAYNQNTTYTVYKNKNLLKRIICCFSNCFGIGFLTKINVDRRMDKLKIKFVKIDITDSTKKNIDNYEYLTIDKRFTDFDSEVTQITQITDTKYILTNYKARYVLMITVALDKK